MIERIGDVVEIGDTVVALRGIIAIVDTAEPYGKYEPCTAIIVEGGTQIHVSREDGAAVRGHLKDYLREQDHAPAPRSPR